jgi:hypothetical protein
MATTSVTFVRCRAFCSLRSTFLERHPRIERVRATAREFRSDTREGILPVVGGLLIVLLAPVIDGGPIHDAIEAGRLPLHGS